MAAPSFAPPVADASAWTTDAVRSGLSPAACAAVVAAHGSLVKGACRRILRDDALAEDAAQETFLLLVRKSASLPPDAPLAGWLYRAACRVALNHKRTTMRRHAREQAAETAAHLRAAADPDLWREVEPHLDAAMLTLPERQRALVVRCYLQRESQRAAAAQLGCSESLVSRELAAAVAALRRFFEGRGISVGAGALTGVLSAEAARGATLAGAPAIVNAMVAAAPASGTVLPLTLLLMKAKAAKITLGLAAAGLAVGSIGYVVLSPAVGSREGTTAPASAAALAEAAAAGTAFAGSGASYDPDAPAFGPAFWRNIPRFSGQAAFHDAMRTATFERDPTTQLALLRRMGVGIAESRLAEVTRGGKWLAESGISMAEVRNNAASFFWQFVKAWAYDDPQAALAWTVSQPGRYEWMLDMTLEVALFGPNATPDDPKFTAFIASIPDTAARERAQFMVRVAGDPEGALRELADGAPKGWNDRQLAEMALHKLGVRTPEEAIARLQATGNGALARTMLLDMARNLPPNQVRELVASEFADQPQLGNMLRAMSGDREGDFPAAARYAATDASSGRIDEVLMGWFKADPRGAITAALGEHRSDGALLPMIATGAAKGTISEAILTDWLAAAPAEQRDRALATLYRAQAKDDPARTLDLIQASNALTDQISAAKAVLRDWAGRNPAAATAWIDSLAANPDRAELAATVAASFAESRPEEAIAFARLEGVPITPGLAAAAARAVAQDRSLEAAIALANQFSDARTRAAAVQQIAAEKFGGEPEKAVAFVAAQNRGGDWTTDAVAVLGNAQLNHQAPERAAAALGQLDLSRQDPRAVGAAASSIAWYWSHENPTAALDWAASLPPAAASAGLRGLLPRLWRNRSHQRAEIAAWVRTANLPPADRAALLREIATR